MPGKEEKGPGNQAQRERKEKPGKRPVQLSGRFVPALCGEQVDEPHPCDRPDVEQRDEQEDHGKAQKRAVKRAWREHKGKLGQFNGKKPQGDQRKPLGKSHAKRKAQPKRPKPHEQRLGRKYAGKAALLHAGEHVDAQLPFAPPEQKTVGIYDQKRQHRCDDHRERGDRNPQLLIQEGAR